MQTSRKPTTARAEGFIPLGFYCEADIWADSVPETGSALGSGKRKGSEAMRRFRWMLTSEEAAQVRSIHLDCGIMETPGQLTSQEIYVLDIPKTRRSNRHTGFGQRRTGENQPHPRNSTHAN